MMSCLWWRTTPAGLKDVEFTIRETFSDRGHLRNALKDFTLWRISSLNIIKRIVDEAQPHLDLKITNVARMPLSTGGWKFNNKIVSGAHL